jgi:hypothetical protein
VQFRINLVFTPKVRSCPGSQPAHQARSTGRDGRHHRVIACHPISRSQMWLARPTALGTASPSPSVQQYDVSLANPGERMHTKVQKQTARLPVCPSSRSVISPTLHDTESDATAARDWRGNRESSEQGSAGNGVLGDHPPLCSPIPPPIHRRSLPETVCGGPHVGCFLHGGAPEKPLA